MIESMLQKLTDFLLELLYFGIDWLYNAMIDCINAIIVIFSAFITGLLALFPSNPCGSLIASCGEITSSVTAPPSEIWLLVVQTIAWLLPVTYLINLVGCVMISVMLYFSLAPLLRWAKLLN